MRFYPKLLTCLREGYSRETFVHDLIAGVTVGIIAIPLAMAFAIASGVSPDRGLFTAITAGFLISLLGGSRVQIGGPTGAFVVIIYSVVQKHGYDGLALATLIAGALVMLMGIFRLGAAIKFIPYPVITGFTSGIALIIFSSQVKDFLGLTMQNVPADFIGKWLSYARALPSWKPETALLAAICLLMMILLRRLAPRFPAAILVVVMSALAVHFLHLPVETIGSAFGGIPHTLPVPALPSFGWQKTLDVLPDAISIALLCAIESLLSAVVADGMTGRQHRSNTELIAQGIANIASVCFGGIPATGAIARTATNIKSGARTPVAGIIHALTLLLALWLLADYAAMIPLAALSAILIIIAWAMSEIRHFRNLLRAPKDDVAVLLITFLLTVLVDLTLAVAVGLILSTLSFMRRMSAATELVQGVEENEETEYEDAVTQGRIPKGVEVYELSGPFFFGAADRLRTVLQRLKLRPQIVILRMRRVPVIDATGLRALEQFAEECHSSGIVLMLTELTPEVEHTFLKSKLHRKLGAGYLLPTLEDALAHAAAIAQAGKS